MQWGVSGNAGLVRAGGEFENGEVERVESSQRDELELVSHGGELALEAGDGRIIQILLPVERGRAVVVQQLAGMNFMHGVGEFARFLEIVLGRFAPENIGIRDKSNYAPDGRLESTLHQ